ncbi:MAG: hypothetical protein IJ744_10335 [Lachnospiraceae bacterium]|nr:hypothetical protein [Lachnospiraceae bacterium]
MKIKVQKKSWEEVKALPSFPYHEPKKQSALLRGVVNLVSKSELKKVHFAWVAADEETKALLSNDVPCLFLMNHSCFTDLEIVGSLLAKKPYHIVTTFDGFVGKDGLLRGLGCIPTQKFTQTQTLVRDMVHVVRDLKESLVMYPEASYTFDGTATPLPESLGKCCRLLGVPVVMIKTKGAFLRDPLYNNLQLRQVDVSARISTLVKAEECRKLSAAQINDRLKEAFTFDNWKDQREEKVRVTEDFRADCLHRVLYRCPVCGAEGQMLGKGTGISCRACGAHWELSELGELVGEGGFSDVPAWYAWERAQVRKELEAGTYHLTYPVRILVLKDTSCVYDVGEGVLDHDGEGFHLTGCEGTLDYVQSADACYSLYADYYWYEIGDMICIGDANIQFYCFPILKEGEEPIVAKARLATEELFKLRRAKKKANESL